MKTIENIIWRFYFPPEFPCMMEGCDNRAVKRVILTDDNTPYKQNLCLCETCAQLPEQELIEGIGR